MLFYLVGFVILYVGYKNLKKGFLWLLVFKLVLQQNIALLDKPGFPLLTLDMFLCMAFAGMYYLRKKRLKRKLNFTKVPFPYQKPFIFITISWILSAIFSLAGFQSAISNIIGNILNSYIIVLMMWKLVESKKDFRFLLKGFTLIMFIACLLSFYEHNTQSNPFIEYTQSLMDQKSEKFIDFVYDNDEARGGYRAQSIFEHPIGGGCNFAMFFAWIAIAYLKIKTKIPYKIFTISTALLCVLSVIFSASRGPILFLLICLFGIVSFKNKRSRIALIIGLLFILGAAPYLSSYSDIFMSIFSKKAETKVGGSNIEMRLEQLQAVFTVMSSSPIVGLGPKFLSVMQTRATDALLGLESMWFSILTTYGVIGAIANIYMAFVSLVLIPKKYPSSALFFFTLSYWVVGSLTSIPGIHMYMFYLIIIYLIKQTKQYKYERNQRELYYESRKLTKSFRSHRLHE